MPDQELETFPNPASGRDYLICHSAAEFTSVCPKTGHPDFGEIHLSYIPSDSCLELKAYKLYLHAFRNEGIFYEAVTNRILDDLVAACSPRWMRVESDWKGRGGIASLLTAEYAEPGFSPSCPLPPLRISRAPAH